MGSGGSALSEDRGACKTSPKTGVITTEAITPLCQRMIEYERAAKKPASACGAKSKTIRIFLLWLVSVPFPHGVLLLFFILKERLLKLTFDADEPFFGTSGTAPKIICFFLECTCSFFGCAQL